MKKFNPILLLLSFFICFSCAGSEKKEMKASDIIGLIKKGKHIQIIDKIIMDDLNFTSQGDPFILNGNALQIEINSNIFFSNCVFMGRVSSNGKKESLPVKSIFKNNVTFSGCDFRGEVDFDGAIVFGMINFSKSIFRKYANFNNLTIGSKDCYFSEIKAEDNFSMVYALFSGNLYCIDAHFDKNVSFQETSVKGKLSFNNTVFKQNAGFDLMEVCGGAFFNYTVFEKNANFSFSRFLYTTEFINTSFKEKGNFEKAFFLNTVRFEGFNPDDNLILTNTFFGNKTIK